MISLLLPSRHRCERLKAMVESAYSTADNPDNIEVICLLDEDDDYGRIKGVKFIKRDKIPLSNMWNECQKVARGNIYMQAADDILFRSQGWDTQVEALFNGYEDRIAFAFGDDGHPSRGTNHGTHGFVSKEWVDAVGYFLPPGYVADWSDQWLNDVARAINRHHYIGGLFIEHVHPALNKIDTDETYNNANKRREESDPYALYLSEEFKRTTDIAKLRGVMK